jgi:hypothetical protein
MAKVWLEPGWAGWEGWKDGWGVAGTRMGRMEGWLRCSWNQDGKDGKDGRMAKVWLEPG